MHMSIYLLELIFKKETVYNDMVKNLDRVIGD